MEISWIYIYIYIYIYTQSWEISQTTGFSIDTACENENWEKIQG